MAASPVVAHPSRRRARARLLRMRSVFVAVRVLEGIMRKTVLAALLALLMSGGNALAENYPSHPITLVVPFSAGGPTDSMARIMADGMKSALGQSFLIENVTGAGGSIGVGRVARAAPDGYTVSIGHLGTHVANGAIYKLGYDLVADFEPVVLLPSNPMVFVSTNAVPAKSLGELLAWMKAKPSPPTAGTAGAGSASHVAGLYFESVTGIKLQFVPYRGTAPAMTDLVAGQIEMIIDEAGLPGFHMQLWSGFWVPKGTPKDIVAKLNAAAVDAMNDPAVRAKFENLGLVMPPKDQLTPEALGAFQRSEIAKWWPMLKAANVKVE